MAIQYVVVTRGNPSDQSAPKKFYAQAKSSGEVTLRSLANDITSISTVSSIDTLAVLEALLQVLPKHLAEGKIVRLGEFGSFSITLSSTGADTAGDFNAGLINSNSIRFRPGNEIKKVLNAVQYKKGA